MAALVLLVEPDASGRSLMERIVRSLGSATEAVRSIAEASGSLGERKVALAVIDEAAGDGAPLAEIRAMRAFHPRVPVIATGTLLHERALLELLREGVIDAVKKPFLPDELRAAVRRGLARGAADHEDAREFAAAILLAKEETATGSLEEAEHALARARRITAFDADTMSLSSLLAELRGDADAADRGYRATIALARDGDEVTIDPRQGLARLAAKEPRDEAKLRSLVSRNEKGGSP